MCALRSASPGRVDGLAKVKGTVLYGDDITLPDMLYGVCRYAHIPAGKIDELDLSGALGVDGVVRIATWQEGGKTPTDYTWLIASNILFNIIYIMRTKMD